MRVLICGDRNWEDCELVEKVVKNLHDKYGIEAIIEGEARGADTCGRLAGEKLGVDVLQFPANWAKYGKGAGPIRNKQMLDEGNPDVVVAFHDDIYNSKGTLNMLKQSSQTKAAVVLVYHSKKNREFDWVWFSATVEGFSLT